MDAFVFWQMIISPHMAGLATALAARQCEVVYVAGQELSAARIRTGWSVPKLPNVEIQVLQHAAGIHDILRKAPKHAVHLTQGVRRNGFVSDAIPILRRAGVRWGAIMETVDDRGVRGFLKRMDYRWALARTRVRPDFVLAIGDAFPRWVAKRGFPAEDVFPFTYFLESVPAAPKARLGGPFRVGFVGRMVALKRLDLLIAALAAVECKSAQLVVIGSGPLETSLRLAAERRLGSARVQWIGGLSRDSTLAKMSSLDCLVLPSEHDGWGAVISEALMAGVPAICSDACGGAAAVRASGVGGVFRSGDVEELRTILRDAIVAGPLPLSRRERIADWARCFGSAAGAEYLGAIVKHRYGGGAPPRVPWSAGVSE